MRRVVRLMCAVLACALPGGACTGGGDDRAASEWGQEGVSLLEADVRSWLAGDWYETLRFYDQNAVFGDEGEIHGLNAMLEFLQSAGSHPFDITLLDSYLGASAGLTVERWLKPVNATTAMVRHIGAGGVDRAEHFFQLVPVGDAVLDPRLKQAADDLAPLVDAYIAGWSTGDVEQLAAVYTPDATVTTWAQPQPWRSAVADVAGGKAPVLRRPAGSAANEALFVYAPWKPVHRVLAMFESVDRRTGCPLKVAQQWELTSGKITSDERFLEVDSVNGCLPATDRPAGWWVDRPAPVPPDQRQSGVQVLADGTNVPLYNSTPHLEAMLAWGLGQFTRAGLTLPKPLSVTFPPTRACQDAAGQVREEAAGLAVTICFDEANACTTPDCTTYTTAAAMFLLHELGHVWTLQQLTDEAQRAFSTAAGLPGWRGSDIPYVQRGAEHAAETLAWGLLEQTHDRYRNLPSPGCDQLVTRFRLLTGVAPLSSCP